MISQAARVVYARQIERRGPAYRNLANSIRAGWTNFWVEPALLAIDEALRFGPQEPDDAEKG